MNATADLAYWITERYSIKLRKEAGMEMPWSPDRNMTDPRYCNVHREDDKVTKWIAKNWRDANVHQPNFVLGMVLARMINLPETLEQIGFPGNWNPERIKAIIRSRAPDHKVWTSAYTISTAGQSIPKEEYVIDQVCSTVHDKFKGETFEGCTLAEAFAKLTEVSGLGSFLAGQVLADLKNTPGHPLQTALDWRTWAAPGPGSLRGLSWYFFGQPDVSIKHFDKRIKEAYDEVAPLLPDYIPPIHMQDFQNCLCEFSKYMRMKNGDRRVRNRYRPG